jgi:Protein of unknown function DUF262
MYKPGGTIKDALKRIERNEYVLPAIQREFVWRPDQICRLFDSLMQGYPFGGFLFWKVEPENSGQYKFYGFVREYHQRDKPHCPELGLLPNQSLTAVLDGQQRLTALNIGLRGSMAIKEPNKWWTNPSAFPRKYLYLDLLAESGEEEEGNRYRFEFLEPEKANRRDGELWFRVGDILAMEAGPEMHEWIVNQGLTVEDQKRAYRILHNLHRVIHTEQNVVYYEEDSQELERVLNIFIRMNSGGTVLSYSDLLLSIAVAQWSKLDARQEIHSLVDDLNKTATGFNFSKDFVLKAGLMLTDIASVGFKVENFNRENMQILEASWSDVKRALRLTVELVASFGFNGQNLRADSALLPIAYYFYRRKALANYLLHSQYTEDRNTIRHWLVRSLVKASGIWGSGLDTLLTALRATMQSEGFERFPAEALRRTMAQRGKSLTFEPEEIEELADMEYRDRRTFALLTILYPFVDLRNQFHVDHVFPANRLTPSRLKRAGVPDDRIEAFIDRRDRLSNLQLLEGPINLEKREKLPAEWLRQHYPNPTAREHYCRLHDLGEVGEEMADFEAFYDARRERLRDRIAHVVNPPRDTLLENEASVAAE